MKRTTKAVVHPVVLQHARRAHRRGRVRLPLEDLIAAGERGLRRCTDSRPEFWIRHELQTLLIREMYRRERAIIEETATAFHPYARGLTMADLVKAARRGLPDARRLAGRPGQRCGCDCASWSEHMRSRLHYAVQARITAAGAV